MSVIFGKPKTAITDYIASYDPFDSEHCVSLLQRFLNKYSDAIFKSIGGHSITDEQKLRIGIVWAHMDHIVCLIEKVY